MLRIHPKPHLTTSRVKKSILSSFRFAIVTSHASLSHRIVSSLAFVHRIAYHRAHHAPLIVRTHIMRTYTFHVPSSLALRAIALDRSDAPSLTGHTAYTCDLRTDVSAIAIAHTLDCALLITRDTDSDDYSRSFGDTARYRVSSTYDAATRTLTFHPDKLGFEIAYAVSVDNTVHPVR